MSVQNKVVLITGSASGLGLGMAKEFAKQGSKVVIADLDLEKSQQSLRFIRFEIEENCVRATSHSMTDAIDDQLSLCLAAVSTACRVVAPQVRALLTPNVSEKYLAFHLLMTMQKQKLQ